MSIYEKLAETQKVVGIVVPYNRTAQAGNRTYKWADLQAVLEKVVPALRDRGLVLVERIVNNSLTVSIVDYAPDEAREELEFVESVYPLPDTKDAQALGSAITYGRRYSIVTMLGLVAGDDDDGAAASNPAPKGKSEDQHDEFVELIAKKLVKAKNLEPRVDPRAAGDLAEAMLQEWGVLRETDVLPLSKDAANAAYRDLAHAIEEGITDGEAFRKYISARAPF